METTWKLPVSKLVSAPPVHGFNIKQEGNKSSETIIKHTNIKPGTVCPLTAFA